MLFRYGSPICNICCCSSKTSKPGMVLSVKVNLMQSWCKVEWDPMHEVTDGPRPLLTQVVCLHTCHGPACNIRHHRYSYATCKQLDEGCWSINLPPEPPSGEETSPVVQEGPQVSYGQRSSYMVRARDLSFLATSQGCPLQGRTSSTAQEDLLLPL